MRFNRKSRNLITALTGVALFTGCASYKPVPLVPLDEYEAIRLRGVSEHSVSKDTASGRSGSETGDQEVMGFPIVSVIDPVDGISLPEANTLALYYSPAISERRREYQIAKAILLEAGLPENPEISVGPRWSTEGTGLIFPASLSFEIPILDEHGPERASATFEVKKNKWLLLNKELEVLAEVQKQTLKLSALKALEDISELQIKRSAELIAWAESLYSGGEIDSFSLQVAQRASVRARTGHMETSLKRKRLMREFLSTLGLFPDADISIELGNVSLLKVLPKESGREKIVKHPALKALEEEYRAAEEALKAEVRSQYPHLAVGPQYEGDRGEPTIGFGIGFKIPVFAQNDAAVALAEVRRDSVRMEYQTALLELLKEGANLRDELSAIKDRLDHLEANAMRETRELNKIFSSSLASADRTVLEALSAADSLAETLSEEIALRERMHFAHIELLLATGSLLPDDLNIDDTISGKRDE